MSVDTNDTNEKEQQGGRPIPYIGDAVAAIVIVGLLGAGLYLVVTGSITVDSTIAADIEIVGQIDIGWVFYVVSGIVLLELFGRRKFTWLVENLSISR